MAQRVSLAGQGRLAVLELHFNVCSLLPLMSKSLCYIFLVPAAEYFHLRSWVTEE